MSTPTTAWATIRKRGWPRDVTPNVVDYEAAYAEFSWEAARTALDGLPGGRGLNIAHEAVDRHAAGPRRDRVAVRWLRRDGRTDEATYGQLARSTNRFANVLAGLGVGRGDRVFTLLGRVPELYVTVLGALKNTSVVCPLFSAFGPEPVRQRLALGDGRVLVTTPTLYRRKVAPVRDQLPQLEHVILVGDEQHADVHGTLDFAHLVATASDDFTIPPTDPEDMALLHFTSGTTGTPKGAIHVHEAVVAHHATGTSALDLHDDDIFWCTADPGWVTGMSYGIIAPLSHGVTCVVDEAEFDAERWYRLLASQGVTVWYTAPTALRMLMRAGADVAHGHDLSRLRFVASVGEPLNPEVVVWGQTAFGLPVHDNWWQTETGGIMVANLAGCDIRPGSMGRALPGVEVALLAQGKDGRAEVRDGAVEVIDAAGVDGELALRPGWPSMFRGYLHEESRYEACFAGGWYLTGDVARRDDDGWLWFVGRADDVIKTAGHLIGPFEVESALMEHPAVAEAGVIGVPDPVAGEVVKAFVSLTDDHEPSDDLRLDIVGFARRRLGAAVAPREIAFDQHLPKTKSGKILRRLLKARELGLPEGDLSTLEAAR
ncbi:MAG: acetate--CoA ligase [Acidimicrobiales bacterium]|nr:acetate--CoA ligase [Acidimicrobiales bacterium]